MNTIFISIPILCWAIFWVYWIVNTSNQKETKTEAHISVTLPYRLLWGLAFIILIISAHASFKNAPAWMALSITGDAIAVIGLLVCIWARKTLAGNWSMQLDAKKGHELITSGPYAYVRHPIYTGFLLLFLGAAMTVGNSGAAIGFLILLIGCYIRIRLEEKFMIQIFGKKYAEYKKHVKALIPCLL